MHRVERAVEEEEDRARTLRNRLFVMQRSVYHCQTWAVIAVVSMVVVLAVRRVESRKRIEEMSVLKKQLATLQTQVDKIKGKEASREVKVKKETKPVEEGKQKKKK